MAAGSCMQGDVFAAGLRALYESADLPLLVLDRERRVGDFTAATRRILAITEWDRGRPLDAIGGRLPPPLLLRLIEQVQETGIPAEEVIESEDKKARYLVSIRPAADGGVVTTFIEVTCLLEADAGRRSGLPSSY